MGLKKRLIRMSARVLVEIGHIVSPKAALRIGDAIVRHVKLDARLNKRQLRDNLHLFFPERDAAWIDVTARAIQSNAVRARLFDKHFLPRLSDEQLDEMARRVNWEGPQRALDTGRGAIIASLHYGRFWSAPVWFSRKGYLASAFQSSRGRLPAEAATLSGGSLNASDPTAALRAVRSLKGGSFLFLLLDAGKIPNPIAVDFLGHSTSLSPSPIRLARAADALIIPGLVPIDPEDPDRVLVTFYDPIDPRDIPADEPVERTMRRILEPIERQVRADPSQWYGAINAHKRISGRVEPRAGG